MSLRDAFLETTDPIAKRRADDAREAWLQDRLLQSQQAREAMREEAERIIAASRKSIQPRLRQVLDDCQADHDDEREGGWAV